MRRVPWGESLASLTLCALLAGCDGGASPNISGIIEVGAIIDFQGDLGRDGELYRAALEVAVADANAAHASQGITFDLDLRDGETDPTASAHALNSLLLEDHRIVLGPQTSSAVLGTQDRIKKSFSLLVSPSSTSTELSVAGDHIFRFSPTDSALVAALVERMWNRGHRALAMVYRDDSWGRSVSGELSRQFAARGGTVVSAHSYVTLRTSLITSILEDVRDDLAAESFGDVDEAAIVLMSFEEGGFVLETVRDSFPDLASFRWYGSDGFANDQNTVETPDLAEFVIQTRLEAPVFGFDVPADMQTTWDAIAVTAGRTPSNYALIMYDAFGVAADALAELPEGADYAALEAEFLRAAETYRGFSGAIVLDSMGDRVGSTYHFMTVTRSGGGYAWTRAGS